MRNRTRSATIAPHLRNRAIAMASIRAGIGVASIAAPAFAAKVVGYPAAHDNASAHLMARLFGVRELLLAGMVVDAARRPGGLTPSVFAVQAAVDASDVAVQSWSLVKRQGIDRAASGGTALAATAAVLWARLALRARPNRPLGRRGSSG
jgi:hypothetical protein